jgi:hypothetical protein
MSGFSAAARIVNQALFFCEAILLVHYSRRLAMDVIYHLSSGSDKMLKAQEKLRRSP